MLKRIVIAAGFVVSLIAAVVVGWTAGQGFYGGGSDAPSSQTPGPVADSSAPPERSSVANATQVVESGPADAPSPMIGNPHPVAYDTKRDEILVPN